MNVKILHFYPDLMNLYGSYANVSLLRRTLEKMGCAVTVETVLPGADADLSDADVLFMGAGTERRQKAALADFMRYRDAVKAAAERGCAMLFCGTAMELLGKRITDCDGKVYDGLAIANFETVQQHERMVEDVYGRSALYDGAVVGFMNKCSIITGITSPLVTDLAMGFGNEGERGSEGYYANNVYASELTGPILIKNPMLLEHFIAAVYAQRGDVMPKIAQDSYLTDGYAVTAEQLKLRSGADF